MKIKEKKANSNTKDLQNPCNAFDLGFSNVPQNQVKKIREEIMNQLAIKSKVAFYYRQKGYRDHSPAERTAIELIFNSIGISEVWGLNSCRG